MAREQTTERARTTAEFMAREADDLGEVARAALTRSPITSPVRGAARSGFDRKLANRQFPTNDEPFSIPNIEASLPAESFNLN